MERTFIMTRRFDEQWNDLGLDDRDLAEFQNQLLANPLQGDMIQGTADLGRSASDCSAAVNGAGRG